MLSRPMLSIKEWTRVKSGVRPQRSKPQPADSGTGKALPKEEECCPAEIGLESTLQVLVTNGVMAHTGLSSWGAWFESTIVTKISQSSVEIRWSDDPPRPANLSVDSWT